MDRLRKRPDFLKAAKGRRWAADSLVLQARRRRDDGPLRIGFTATRKIGGAVARNRARRRLREAARQVLPVHGRPGHDYVLIGRRDTLTRDFSDMLDDLQAALHKVHGEGRSRDRARGRADDGIDGRSNRHGDA